MPFLDRFWRPRRTAGAWHARMALSLATFDHEWQAQRGILDSTPPRLFPNLTMREMDVALAHLHDPE